MVGVLTELPLTPAPPHPDRNIPPKAAKRTTNVTTARNFLLGLGAMSEINPASTKPPPTPPHGLTARTSELAVAAVVDMVTVVDTLLAFEPRVTFEPAVQIGGF